MAIKVTSPKVVFKFDVEVTTKDGGVASYQFEQSGTTQEDAREKLLVNLHLVVHELHQGIPEAELPPERLAVSPTSAPTTVPITPETEKLRDEPVIKSGIIINNPNRKARPEGFQPKFVEPVD